MKKYFLRTSFLIFLFLIFSSGKLFCQSLAGKIVDTASGEPVPFVKLKIENSAQIFYSDDKGFFEVPVEIFPVEIYFSASGYYSKSKIFRRAEKSGEIQVFLVPKAENLSEVILRGTIIPESVQQTPAAVNIISEEDIQRFDAAGLPKVLSITPGLYVHRGALNTNKISIRGIGARSQYSTNRVKMYFEGIPLTTAEGISTLDDIAPEMVERIEVIKGPASSVYGAGLGGVINLYAAQPDQPGSKASVASTFGSFGLMKNSVTASHFSGGTTLSGTYNHLEADGFRENSGYDRDSFLFNGSLATTSENSLSFLASFTRLKAFIPSSLNRQVFEENPSAAAGSWAASKGFESYNKGMLGISYEHQFYEGFRNITSIYFTFKDAYEPRPFDILIEDQIAGGARTKFNTETFIFGIPSEFSFGGEYYREWYDSATFENLYEQFPGEGSVGGSILSNNRQIRSYYNLFAQGNFALSEKFKIESGFNFNNTFYQLSDIYHQDETDQSGKYRFSTIFSPRIGVVYNLTEEKIFYASISHGFSTPTVAETLTPAGLINTDLQPETGINYEIGFKANWFNRRIYSEIALYSIQIENLIVAERVAEDQYIGRNVGKTDHSGIEFLLNYNFEVTPSISGKFFTNAAFNFFRFDHFIDSGNDFSGNILPGVPDKTISGGIELSTESGFSFYTNFQHVGEIPLNDLNSLFTEEYSLLSLKSSYVFSFLQSWGIKIFAGVNNLLDEKYASSVIPNAVGFGGASPRYYYPGNPRNYFAGLNLNYNF